jgi:hypothetical protein
MIQAHALTLVLNENSDFIFIYFQFTAILNIKMMLIILRYSRQEDGKGAIKNWLLLLDCLVVTRLINHADRFLLAKVWLCSAMSKDRSARNSGPC